MFTSLLTLARFLVLFCESYSIVAAERTADVDLLRLCTTGAAADSVKFRSLCLRARSESASPLVLKALLKSFKDAFLDFSETLNSPSRVVMLVLFCFSGLALPVVKAVSKLATLHLGPERRRKYMDGVSGIKFDDEEDQENCHVVVLDSGRQGIVSSLRARLPGSSRKSIRFSDEEDEFDSGQDEKQHSYVPLGFS